MASKRIPRTRLWPRSVRGLHRHAQAGGLPVLLPGRRPSGPGHAGHHGRALAALLSQADRSSGWRIAGARQTRRRARYDEGSGVLPIGFGRGPGDWSATGSVAQQQSARPQTSIRIPPRATLHPQSAHSIYDLLYPRFDAVTQTRLMSEMMVSSSGVPNIELLLNGHAKHDTMPRQKL